MATPDTPNPMTIKEAKLNVGCVVFSRDAGDQTTRSRPWHGPWTIKAVTKNGIAIIKNNSGEERRVSPSLLRSP